MKQPCTPVRGQSGVRVIVLHPKASPAGVVSTTTTVPGEALIPQPAAPVNNAVRDDTWVYSGDKVARNTTAPEAFIQPIGAADCPVSVQLLFPIYIT